MDDRSLRIAVLLSAHLIFLSAGALRILRGQPEGDAHDHGRDEDRPAFDDRGATWGHAPKGMSAGTRSAYRR